MPTTWTIAIDWDRNVGVTKYLTEIEGAAVNYEGEMDLVKGGFRKEPDYIIEGRVFDHKRPSRLNKEFDKFMIWLDEEYGM